MLDGFCWLAGVVALYASLILWFFIESIPIKKITEEKRKKEKKTEKEKS